MKKSILKIFAPLCVLVLVICTLTTTLVGCGKNNDKKSIVCTSFAQYDWIREILGEKQDNFNLTFLTDSGVDLHSYQPSVADIAEISNSDLFVYVGGESDEWVEDTITVNMNTIALLDLVEAKYEEIVDGMEHEHEHEEGEEGEDHDHEEDEDHDHEHEHEEFDEHVWLSLKNAKIIVDELVKAICELDEENASEYQANATAYNAKLTALDERYQTAVSAAQFDTLVFADRFPFRYLVDDYDLKYFAAFAGCSAETEASFETIAFLANKVNELSLKAVCVIENSDQGIANTVVANTQSKNQTIVVFDSCQSVTGTQAKNGTTYYSIMESNLTALTTALN